MEKIDVLICFDLSRQNQVKDLLPLIIDTIVSVVGKKMNIQ